MCVGRWLVVRGRGAGDEDDADVGDGGGEVAGLEGDGVDPIADLVERGRDRVGLPKRFVGPSRVDERATVDRDRGTVVVKLQLFNTSSAAVGVWVRKTRRPRIVTQPITLA